MANPFIGEIKLFAGTFAPLNYAFCNGQLLPIANYTDLFSLLGTRYGGDGQSTFALPNLNGRVAIGMDTGPGLSPRAIGESLGADTVTLNANQLPAHRHGAQANSGAANSTAAGAVWAASDTRFATSASNVNMNLAALQSAGAVSPTPHNNLQPVLGLNYIIALFGVYPSRN
jgi:microcystin-dependent protein